MTVRVREVDGGYRIDGDWEGLDAANAFLAHLSGRGFSAATVRAYAFDVLNLARFLDRTRSHAGCSRCAGGVRLDRLAGSARRAELGLQMGLGRVRRGVDGEPAGGGGAGIVRVPGDERAAGRQSGARRRGAGRGCAARSGACWVIWVRDAPVRAAGWCGSRDCFRNRCRPATSTHSSPRWARIGIGRWCWRCCWAGCGRRRCAGLLLADVDMGRRRLRVIGKGGKERHVPVDAAFFTELAAYLRWERPPGLATPQCFVVLRGPTTGAPVSEAGLRSLFRRHRELSGATRVRPHRLRHTYGTELASAGIDLLALRALMGHVSPETTARYVHLSVEQLAAEYGAARAHVGGSTAMTTATLDGGVRRRRCCWATTSITSRA